MEEKRFFHLKNLHLGHLAKSFALRDAPSALPSSKKTKEAKEYRPAGSKWEQHDDEGKMDAEKRMQEAVRKQGKLTKRGGVMGDVGTGDYQLGGGSAELERMVNGFAKKSAGTTKGGAGGKRKR